MGTIGGVAPAGAAFDRGRGSPYPAPGRFPARRDNTMQRRGEAMQFGLQINPYQPGATGNPWDTVAPAAQAADEGGYDSVWVYDHFLYEGGYSGHPYPEPVMECFTTLGAIAAIT